MPRILEPLDAYVRVAGLVRAGEWTSYGDISIAVHGHVAAARAVGRAAATVLGFPNAERVIGKGGRIPAGWGVATGGGPEECRRRLEAQGVRFEEGLADPSQHVGWEILVDRAREARITPMSGRDVVFDPHRDPPPG